MTKGVSLETAGNTSVPAASRITNMSSTLFAQHNESVHHHRYSVSVYILTCDLRLTLLDLNYREARAVERTQS